jgi:hypothetical protein
MFVFDVPNIEIRRAIRWAGLCHWQVAECLGMSEVKFCRLLRKLDLPEEIRAEILAAIERLVKERDAMEQKEVG